MNKLYILALLSILLLIGCKVAGTDNVLAPAIKTDQTQKTVSFLRLPYSLEPRTLYKAGSFLITPQTGGNLKYSDSYQSAYGIVSINIILHFPPNAVSDSIIVSFNVSQDGLTGDFGVTFGPTPNSFLLPALLTFRVKGLDPAILPSDPANIQFVCMDNGTYVPVNASHIFADVKHGSLSVVNAEIFHFSKYGWSNIR